MTRRKRKRRNK